MNVTHQAPELECDLVMKGGITSGIVYPGAIKVLSDHYRLRAIGGASAGAIGAACAAAAEYGRASGGFDRLALIPEELAAADESQQTLLLRLFKPEPETAAILSWFKSGLSVSETQASGRNPKLRAMLRWSLAAVRAFPLFGIPAVLLGLAVAVAFAVAATPTWVYQLPTFLGGSVLGAIVALVIALLGLFFHLTRDVSGNLYGLVTGLGSGADDPDALTPWLHRKIQSLAGLPSDRPLTFGDLWGASECETHARRLDLRLMTTAVSHGRAHSFPLEEETKFYFQEVELRRLFPSAIVDHMIKHQRPQQGNDAEADAFSAYLAAHQFHRLPLMADLPILLPVRMSLAFPLLLSAVPLHARRFTKSGYTMDRIWFSDGGIISNFPIHFFDALVPSRPTFGINLKETAELEAATDPDEFVHLPLRNGPSPQQYRPIGNGGTPSLGGFLKSVLYTMHEWSDTAQLRAPGYSDRVATISLRAGEGGINLRMSSSLIRKLARRGEAAGRRLVNHYHPLGTLPVGAETTWANHRWVRYLTAGRLIEQALAGMLSCEKKLAGKPFALEALHENQPSYQRNRERTRAALDAHKQILELAQWFEKRRDELAVVTGQTRQDTSPHPPEIYGLNYPRPRSELRIRPRD